MSNEPKHTPTPWQFKAQYKKDPTIYDDNNRVVAFVVQGRDVIRFIVKACNAYDDLVTALETIASAHTTDKFAFRCAEAALALVKGV